MEEKELIKIGESGKTILQEMLSNGLNPECENFEKKISLENALQSDGYVVSNGIVKKGKVTVGKTGSVEKYKSFTGKVNNATGVHDLYICFDKASGDVRLDWWQFK